MANTWVCMLAAALVAGVQLVSTDGPCAGYEGVLEKLQVCDGTESSIVSVDNINATLRDDCHIDASGIASYKDFTTALVKYDIKVTPTNSPFRNLIQRAPSKGEIDGCLLMNMIPKEFLDVVKNMGMATSCPVTAKTINITESTTNNLSEIPNYKILLDLLAALGHTTGRVSAVHDTGESCLEFAWLVKKKDIVPQ